MDIKWALSPTSYALPPPESPPSLLQSINITQEDFIKLAASSGGSSFRQGTHYIVRSNLRLQDEVILSMPAKLTIRGRFDIRNCQIEEIRSDIEVDGSFFISECNQLKGIYGKIKTGKALVFAA